MVVSDETGRSKSPGNDHYGLAVTCPGRPKFRYATRNRPEVVVSAEIHMSETPGEMLGYPAARPEVEITPVTEVVSAQTAAPSLAATAGGSVCLSVRPSAFMSFTETASSFPLPARPEIAIKIQLIPI